MASPPMPWRSTVGGRTIASHPDLYGLQQHDVVLLLYEIYFQ